MYITSSNLSYSGLIKNHEVAVEINNLEEIKYIENELSELMQTKNVIDDDSIFLMSKSIDYDQFELFRNLETTSYETETDIYNDEEFSINNTIEDEVTEVDITITDQININNTLNEINAFHNTMKIELDKFNEKEFETSGLVFDEVDDYLIKADRDYNTIKNHILNTFNKSLNLKTNEVLIDDLISCFIESSWFKSLEPLKNKVSKERKKFFNELGKLTFWFFIDEAIFKSKKYIFNGGKDLHDLAFYIRKNYLFYEILKSLKLNIYLYKVNIRRSFVEDIFYELLGTLLYHTNFSTVKNIFQTYLNRLDEFIYDNYKDIVYKSLLQELTQQKFGLPQYTLIKESGEDHLKEFEYNVYINKELLGTGKSFSKKTAQENAAENSIKSYLSKYGDDAFLNQENIKLSKYELPSNRLYQLEKLNKRLPFSVKNLELLDISFNSIHWVKQNTFSRENSNLSHLGSSLESLLRNYSLMKKYKKLDTSNYNTHKELLKKINLTVYLQKYFDDNNFKEFVQVTKNDQISTAFKIDVIRSLIAIYFLELGFDTAKKFVSIIWNDYNFDTNSYMDYVSELQDFLQKNFKDSKIEYKVISEIGQDHEKLFKVGCFINNELYGVGKGKNKKEGRRLAAKLTYNNEKFNTKFKRNNL